MTKEEAVSFIKENKGSRVSHRFFSKEEWIGYDETGLICESGYLIESEFFAIRTNDCWNDGWFVVKE